MIKVENNVFFLNTKNTSYIFDVLETGQLQHLYYGRSIHIGDVSHLRQKHAFLPGNTISYDKGHSSFSLEDVDLEFSAIGKGDIREPMVEVLCHDHSSSLDFVFDSYEILEGKEAFENLPSSYDDAKKVQTLNVTLKDKNKGFTLVLSYYVYEDCDVISRSVKFINSTEESVKIKRILSLLLDFDEKDMKITSFHGGWTREMKRDDLVLSAGKYVNSSFTGTSSNRTNPLIFLSDKDSNETAGSVFGFNLIYSGNHYSAVEVSAFNKTRFVTGINPMNFGWLLEPGQDFRAPEAVMTYSAKGFRQASHNFHHFVREHITRGPWKKKERLVLINSWEASYFNFDEGKLLKLARAAKNLGIELFVMDDGWFGQRDDDTKALGDWDIVNKKKLPKGLEGLSKKLNDMGMAFGLWVEPEMVNVDSNLYKNHPDWAIDIPDQDHSEGRNQRLLDLCNPDVVDYLIDTMRKVFSTPGLSYIKWDMNRNFSDYYSKYLPKERQEEVGHRYVLGLYRLLDTLTGEFPEILMEGCASGGNRFDLGALSYFPQIWASDNSDAVCRLSIQDGYSYGYPQCCYTAHVSSCPNHQTLRVTPLESRFAVSAFGVLGYELNLIDAKPEELAAIKDQVSLYKKYRKVLQFGDFYRLRSDNVYQWEILDRQKTCGLTFIMQKEAMPGEEYLKIKCAGLQADKVYHFFGRSLEYNLKGFGDLVNTVAPVHIKQDSLVHNMVAKFVKMPGETEDYTLYGDNLMEAGLKLHQAFVGTGYNDQVRYFPDYSSRLYFIEMK
ncbi:MAG: alpha-galactosidase [Pseudobutyrivibrio sp.]|nr:alpha-galactosidase [Pseudobutyrivibrio sp.]